ncbi:hypothetical protein AVEN_1879-1 [Araneus ventricosus]|uniref:OTU domain-containing protein n=1 Tax=Araneus ventricosus TaxID=182803 RepID=A0A4Y2RRC4_ARAVE|nr:hypothetical protein AVEN_1879-1 [Araneus ventricosus]
MEGGGGQTTIDAISRRHNLSNEKNVKIGLVIGAGESLMVSAYYFKYIDPNNSITMPCQKYCKIPIVGDGNCLVRAISFCIYGSEDFYAEIREKFIQNTTTRWSLLKDFTILKESVAYKELDFYYGFMVCSTDLHAVFKTEKVVAESLEAARWQGQC